MRPRASLAGLTFDRKSGGPLNQQLARYLRDLILTGQLKRGEHLLGSRVLAKELDCSRTVVLQAFDLLSSEGYLDSVPRGRVMVAADIPEERRKQRRAPEAPEVAQDAVRIAGRWLEVVHDRYESSLHSIFSPGAPDLDEFPFDHWSRLARRFWRQPSPELYLNMSPFGYAPLRTEIAAFLRNVRGLVFRPEQVVVTSGVASALNLCARMLIEPGDEVWLEEPGFVEARWALQSAGARLVPVPVDSEGLQVDAGIRLAPHARVAIVTPSHQYPTGVVMSPERRLALLRWAQQRNAIIIEDDYNTEFRRQGNMIASLQSLDDDGRVIYLGTFSKLLFPSLRLGYLIASRPIATLFAQGRERIDLHTSMIAQPILAEFIRDGSLLRHLRRMRRIYAERHDALCAEFARQMSDEFDLSTSPGGLHMIVHFSERLSRRMSDHEAAARTREAGIFVQPLSQAYINGPAPRAGLLVGYSRIRVEDVAACVARLKRALG